HAQDWRDGDTVHLGRCRVRPKRSRLCRPFQRHRSSMDLLCRHNPEVGIMHPTTLFAAVWEHLAECTPETESSIADGQHRRAHTTSFEIAQLLGPRLRGLPIAVADRDQLLAAIGAHANEYQAAQPLVFQTN